MLKEFNGQKLLKLQEVMLIFLQEDIFGQEKKIIAMEQDMESDIFLEFIKGL